MDQNIRRTIILDNYEHPFNRSIPSSNDYIKHNSNNVSCIDNLDLYIKIKDNIIEDIQFEGEACVISISSTSIMIQNFIGKTIPEALDIIKNYQNMINEEPYNEEILKDAIVYNDIYKQPSRKKCATLSVNGIEEVLKAYLKNNPEV